MSEIGNEGGPQDPSKRRSLRLGLLSMIAIAANACGLKVENPLTALIKDRPYGQFLDLVDDKLVLSERPVAVRAEFIPTVNSNTQTPQDKVLFRKGAPSQEAEENSILPTEIKATFAVRVAGATFSSYGPDGNREIVYEKRVHRNGLWFMASDEQGKPVNPITNNPLQKDEKPYFVSANQVTVIKPATVEK